MIKTWHPLRVAVKNEHICLQAENLHNIFGLKVWFESLNCQPVFFLDKIFQKPIPKPIR